MLTVIPNSGKASPKMRFDLNMDLKGCSYSHKVIANPKTKQPLFQELIGIDETNTGFQRLSYNCKFLQERSVSPTRNSWRKHSTTTF